LNNMLPHSIAIKNVQIVHPDFHARFDAIARSYSYFIHFQKDPFLNAYSYYCSYRDSLDISKFHEVVELIRKYEDFASFCKAHSDNKTTLCKIYDASWQTIEGKDQMVFDITADRYLRGMIRLIVGACINAARGKMTLAEIETCLKDKTPLKINWSAPPQGLFLSKVEY
jgi:tRNA pseudouridine38-40 synthase